MVTIIICAFIVVFVGLFCEIRLASYAVEIEHLKALIKERDERYKSLHKLSENMLEDYETIYEVLSDQVGEDEIDNLCALKRTQLLEDELDD